MLQVGDVIKSDKVGPGKWVVTRTEMSGGGTGHGPGDVFPDGWCVDLFNPATEETRYFYQSGSFRSWAMLREDEYTIVGKAKQYWEMI